MFIFLGSLFQKPSKNYDKKSYIDYKINKIRSQPKLLSLTRLLLHIIIETRKNCFIPTPLSKQFFFSRIFDHLHRDKTVDKGVSIMSNMEQENFAEETQEVITKKDPLEEIGDSLDLSGINISTIKPEVFRKLSYWQKWSLRRQAGLFYYTATYAVYTFVAYVAFKMFFQVYSKDFRFRIDWWSLPLAIAVGLAFWFVHEAIYKKKLSDAAKK